MISAHHFIYISHNISNLWMRLIFLETRHPGLQFEHKKEAIPIRIESDMMLALYAVIAVTGKPNFAYSSLSSIFTFNAPDFSKG